MLESSEKSLRDAEFYLGIAVKALKKAVDTEWALLDDGDCETDELIDRIESVCDEVERQKTALFKMNLAIASDNAAAAIPNALRMLEDD